MSKLTQKQEQSCHDFIETGNKSEAYRRNYSTKNMSENTLNVEAVKHFNIPKISLRVKELQKDVEKRNEVSQDKVINELAIISFYDIRNLFDKNGNVKNPTLLTQNDGKAISSIKSTSKTYSKGEDVITETSVEYKLNNKNTSIEQISKILGYFAKDNEQSKSEINIPQFNVTIAPKKKE